MRGALAGSVLGSGLILIAAWFWLAWTPLAHARECAGLTGIASYYGAESGSTTASGSHFNPWGMTAAMWSGRFGSRLRVTDMRTGRSVVVTLTDRGPAKRLGRLIDLSAGAARRLGMGGLAKVCVERVG